MTLPWWSVHATHYPHVELDIYLLARSVGLLLCAWLVDQHRTSINSSSPCQGGGPTRVLTLIRPTLITVFRNLEIQPGTLPSDSEEHYHIWSHFLYPVRNTLITIPIYSEKHSQFLQTMRNTTVVIIPTYSEEHSDHTVYRIEKHSDHTPNRQLETLP